MKDKKAIADLVAKAIFNFDPYNGADYDEMLDAVEDKLKTADGCKDIIRELSEMLLDN